MGCRAEEETLAVVVVNTGDVLYSSVQKKLWASRVNVNYISSWQKKERKVMRSSDAKKLQNTKSLLWRRFIQYNLLQIVCLFQHHFPASFFLVLTRLPSVFAIMLIAATAKLW